MAKVSLNSMFNRFHKVLSISICSLFVFFTPVFAQTVALQGGSESGHGFLLKHGSTCYVVTPRHVVEKSQRATVFSAAPVQHSGVFVERPFWDGIDLAVGTVRGAVESRCTETLNDLSGDVSIADGRRVQLLRLRPSGDIEKIDMEVTRSDYLTLEARITAPGQELFKGTSGAFLFDGDRPIGMIVEAMSSTEGRFMRIEEIHMNLARRLNRSAGLRPTNLSSNDTSLELVPGIPVSFERASLPPIFPDLAETNMLGSGAYVFQLSRPNRIAFRIKGSEAKSLRSVKIVSNPEGDYTLPKGIRVDVSSAPDGSRPRPFAAGDMGPDGVFATSRAPTLVRWIFITVTGAWENGPVGIESLAFE